MRLRRSGGVCEAERAVDHEPDRTLSRTDLVANPMLQFRRWYDDAEAEGIPLANAMALATADAEGRPSVRHVLLREFADRGFVFYTNLESRKGGELAENPNAALTILWKELDRQVCATGAVELVSREESEAYFGTRPREARIGAWASRQSRVLGSREELDARYRELDARYPGDEVPLPPFWGGFLLRPAMIEFWQGRPFRLHDRFRYVRNDASPNEWTLDRLFP
jgi:pyridoxamine 5'-phosphate oxidase